MLPDFLGGGASAGGLTIVPCFYFDIRDDGSFIPDEDGQDMAGLDEARQEAKRALVDAAWDRIGKADGQQLVIEVSDEHRNPVLRASLRFDIESLT